MTPPNLPRLPVSPGAVLTAIWPSVVRTFVPLVAGQVAAWLLQLGVDFDSARLTTIVSGAFTLVYYLGFRLLETYGSNAWGWFLGLARQPVYAQPAGVVEGAVVKSDSDAALPTIEPDLPTVEPDGRH